MKNKLLSFLIPTYNRAELLDISLTELISQIKEYQFEIIICDNASSDNTTQVIEKHKEKYPYIKSFVQNENSGYDRNVASSFYLASSEYIWLLGDSNTVIIEMMPKLISLLVTNKYDAFVVNQNSVVKDLPTQIYTNASNLLSDLGWRMTHLCSTIVSNKFIKGENFNRYLDTYFVPFGMFYEHIISLPTFQVLWLSDNFVKAINFKKKSWQSSTFEVFTNNWFTLIMSLPNQIPLEIKLKCIKDHDRMKKLFGVKNLLSLRMDRYLNYRIVNKHKYFLPFVTSTPIWVMFAISLIPPFIIRFGYKIQLKLSIKIN